MPGILVSVSVLQSTSSDSLFETELQTKQNKAQNRTGLQEEGEHVVIPSFSLPVSISSALRNIEEYYL